MDNNSYHEPIDTIKHDAIPPNSKRTRAVESVMMLLNRALTLVRKTKVIEHKISGSCSY